MSRKNKTEKKKKLFSSVKNIFVGIGDNRGLKWIFSNAKGQRLSITVLTVINVLLASMSVLVSFLLRNIINSATAKDTASDILIRNIAFWGVLFAATILIQIAMRIISNHLVFRITARLTISMKTKLYSNMLRKSYSQITRLHTGEMLNRLNNDVNSITSAITSLIPGVVYMLVKLIGIFVVLFTIDPLFTVLFVIVGVAVFCFSSLFKNVMKKYHKQIFETDGKIRSFMQETLGSLLVIKVFKAEDKVVDDAVGLQELNYRRKRKRNIVSLTTQSVFSLAFNAAYLFGLIFCAVKIANHDPVITYGVLSQVISLVAQVSSPIQSLTGILPTYYGAVASAERIMEIENMDDEVIVNDSDIDYGKLYRGLESIRFDDITFSYDRELIFDSTSLTVNKGDLAVMTGISGIGKSTLTKLLLGVFPLDKGEIYLKLKNGDKVTVDRNLRRFFAYVPQGNFLLSGTLRDNISFIKNDATDDEIMNAAKFACADFINDLPQGLDTVIGEKGLGLSEGQVQRVAIARAFLSDAPIILLDEATSALDEATELQLLHNIKMLSDKTCILISHKKAANSVCNKEIRIVDKKIVVLHNDEQSKT